MIIPKPLPRDTTFKLHGYIASDTFGNTRQNTHFADIDGNIVCGTKNRFGMDCHTNIRFLDYEQFETDYIARFDENLALSAFLRRNHLPAEHFITCKKCQNKVKALLNLPPKS